MSELSPQQEKSIEDAVDKRGFSYDDARRAEGLEQPRDELQRVNTAAPRGRASRPAYGRHRGGRSFNEPSDSELDPYWSAEPALLSPEQMEVNRRGIALARQALAETQQEKDESDPMAAAKKRAREEKRRK